MFPLLLGTCLLPSLHSVIHHPFICPLREIAAQQQQFDSVCPSCFYPSSTCFGDEFCVLCGKKTHGNPVPVMALLSLTLSFLRPINVFFRFRCHSFSSFVHCVSVLRVFCIAVSSRFSKTLPSTRVQQSSSPYSNTSVLVIVGENAMRFVLLLYNTKQYTRKVMLHCCTCLSMQQEEGITNCTYPDPTRVCVFVSHHIFRIISHVVPSAAHQYRWEHAGTCTARTSEVPTCSPLFVHC